MTSKIGDAIKVWADELRPRRFDVPLGAQKKLQIDEDGELRIIERTI
jgi:hypothetical protein